MRRAQIDAGSQPVRNQATNPGFETLSGSLDTVRTNLCPYPNMSLGAAGGVNVHTNLCTNPRGVFTLSDYAGAGNQTITANVAITGHPDGITTANRVSYINGAVNPGVTLVPSVTSGATYTVSAWVYHETIPTGGTQGLAQAGVGSQPSPPAITQGVWTRMTWVAYVASGTSALGFRVSGSTGTGSFLITGILIENSGYLVNFFDGASAASGDFTHAWVGTANASMSVQQAPSVTGWTARWFGSTGGAGANYQSTDTVYDGPFMRKLWRLANTGGANDTGWNLTTRTNVTTGKIYTMSATYRCSIAQHVSLFVQWYDAAGSLLGTSTQSDQGTLVPNTWTRFTLTTPAAPTDAVTASFNFSTGAGSIAVPAGTTFDLDQVMIEESLTMGTFFTGSYPGVGDYTHSWAGTVNASESLMKGPIIAGGMSAVALSAYGATDWASNGSRSARLTPKLSTSNDTFLGVGGDTGGFRLGMQPGKTYTVKAVCRLAAAQTGTINTNARSIKLFWKKADGNYTSAISNVAPNAAGVTLCTVTATIPVDATEAFVRLYNGAYAGNGDVYWDNFMLVEGPYSGDYLDGTKTFSKWDGTAHASTSVGYPPQFLDIAGKPFLEQLGVGTSADPAVSPFAARTIYHVYETAGTNAQSWNVPLYVGLNAPSVGFTVQTAAAGSLNISPRLDFDGGGDTNKSLAVTNGRTLARRHILAVSVPDGITSMAGHLDGGALTGIATINPGPNGWPSARLRGFAATEIKNIYSCVYMAEHDAATRLAVSRYLGNKYGANVA